jgi:hypothetical protein
MSSSTFIDLNDPVVFQSFGGEQYWEKASVPAGQVVLQEQELGQDFYYIVSGQVEVFKAFQGEGQTKQVLARLGQGDFFGEGALLSGEVRGATVQTLKDCEFLKLSKTNFDRYVLKDSQAALGIVLSIGRALSTRLHASNQRLSILQKVAHLSSQLGGDTNQIMPALFSALGPLLPQVPLLFFARDGSLRFSSSAATKECSSAMQASILDHMMPLQNGERSVLDGPYLYAGVYSVQGDFVGTLAACLPPESPGAQALVCSVARELGHLF